MSKYRQKIVAEAERLGIPNIDKLSLQELVAQVKDRGGSTASKDAAKPEETKTVEAKVEAKMPETAKPDTISATVAAPAGTTKTETHVGAPSFVVHMPAMPVPAQAASGVNVHSSARGWRDDFGAIMWWVQAAAVGAFAMMVLAKMQGI